jgi:hypothetical protein
MVKSQRAGDENSEHLVCESQLWRPPIPPREKTSQDTMLEHIVTRIKNIKKDSTPFPTITEETLEHLLGKENLVAQEGEQKYYILPDQLALQKLMGSMPAVASGEFTQNRWWHKTNVEVDNKEDQQSWSQIADRLQTMEEKLQRIENLLYESSFSGENKIEGEK